jgi:hypothetical protein
MSAMQYLFVQRKKQIARHFDLWLVLVALNEIDGPRADEEDFLHHSSAKAKGQDSFPWMKVAVLLLSMALSR